MKDLHPSKLYHKDVFSSIQEYDFLKLVTSVHYSKLYKPPSPPPPDISNLLASTSLNSIFTTFSSLKK